MDLFKAEIWRSFTKLTFVIFSLVVITSAFSCNFDTSMCGFVQDSNDNFDWTRHQGSTPSTGTGPSDDHTTGTQNGYYMYIEASYPRRTGDYAKLNSPKLEFSGSMCLRFFYHMYGANMGKLTVSVNGNSVFNASGDKGDKWLRAGIDVNLSGEYAVTFEASKGLSYRSDIAIDDFSLESGSCLMVCADPGIPLHGSRTVNSKDGGFSEGAIVSFQCNANYKLRGAKEIMCTKGKWSEKKLPLCLSQGCILPPPTFAHAHVRSNPVLNTKGSYVEYACDLGYRVSDHRPTRLLCDKDPKTLGYKWSGDFTCEKISCSPPPLPSTGHGNVSVRTSGSTTEASYSCNRGYVMLDFRRQIVETFVMKCDLSGSWSSSSPTCVKTCHSLDGSLDHGYIESRSEQHRVEGRYIYLEGTVVTFACDAPLYKLQENTGQRRCLKSGSWSGSSLHCVPSACSDPGRIPNGQATSNSTDTQFPIWTVVTFQCMAGYKLVGPSERQCRTDGTWSEIQNPICEASTVTCIKPGDPDHGRYKPDYKTIYKINEVITVVCNGGFYLWGEATKRCCGLEDGAVSAWLPKSWKCSVPTSSDPDTECLNAQRYDQECQKRGKHAVIINENISCKATSEGKRKRNFKLQ